MGLCLFHNPAAGIVVGYSCSHPKYRTRLGTMSSYGCATSGELLIVIASALIHLQRARAKELNLLFLLGFPRHFNILLLYVYARECFKRSGLMVVGTAAASKGHPKRHPLTRFNHNYPLIRAPPPLSAKQNKHKSSLLPPSLCLPVNLCIYPLTD